MKKTILLATLLIIVAIGFVREPGWFSNKSCKMLRILLFSAEVVLKLKFPNNSIISSSTNTIDAQFPHGNRNIYAKAFGYLGADMLTVIQSPKAWRSRYGENRSPIFAQVCYISFEDFFSIVFVPHVYRNICLIRRKFFCCRL